MRGAWLWARSDLRRRWLSLVVVALFIAFASGTTMALVAGARRGGHRRRSVRDGERSR